MRQHTSILLIGYVGLDSALGDTGGRTASYVVDVRNVGDVHDVRLAGRCTGGGYGGGSDEALRVLRIRFLHHVHVAEQPLDRDVAYRLAEK